MTDEDGFLRAIQAAPTDPIPKLVYADWLDEAGRPDQAEFLRLAAARSGRRKAGPDSKAGRRYSDLANALNPTWVRYMTTPVPVWDVVTTASLGELQGVLDAYAAWNAHPSDIGYDFGATLVPKAGTVQQLADAAYGPDHLPVALHPLPGWRADLRRHLRDWLFHSHPPVNDRRGATRPGLAVQTAGGRDAMVIDVLGRISGVVTPVAGWRAQVADGRRFYALDWVDLVLEGRDRVLFLHLSFSD